jgi:hypothetical protein
VPYALIPDGYTLKKVTKLQKEAVNAKRRHDDVVALLNNPNTPQTVAAVVAIPLLTSLIFKVLEDEGQTITADVKDKIIKTSPAYWLFKTAEFGTAKGVEVGSALGGEEGLLDKVAREYASYITGDKK